MTYQGENIKRLLVSRHAGALDWIQRHHPSKTDGLVVMKHVGPDDVKGAIVYGTLPLRLIPETFEYWDINMDVPLEARGNELTADDMDRFGATLTHYIVNRIETGFQQLCICPVHGLIHNRG